MELQRENSSEIIVQVDKTVVKITGLEIKGLDIQQLEAVLKEKVKGLVRIIGVTGQSVEMDVYGIEEEDILRNADGIINAISLAEGITVKDVTQLSSVKKIQSVDIDNIPEYKSCCIGERWAEND